MLDSRCFAPTLQVAFCDGNKELALYDKTFQWERNTNRWQQVRIGTQQLDFIGNCQCRAQVPILFDSTVQYLLYCTIQIIGYYYLSIMGTVLYLDIVTLFWGSLQHKRGILGHRIALSTFDNDYLLWGTFIGTVLQHT